LILLSLQVWFFEHIQLKNVKRSSGCIPRYLNWALSGNWRRSSFDKALLGVRRAFVNVEPLKLLKAEEMIRENGFIACSYFKVLNCEKELQRASNDAMFKLISEMAHIFIKFGKKPCELLCGELQKERLIDIDYDGKYRKLPSIDDLPIDDLKKFFEEVERLENLYSAKKERETQSKARSQCKKLFF